MGAFPRFLPSTYAEEAVQYIPPEVLWERESPKKESDVHALAMTSFSVRSPVVNYANCFDTISPLRSGSYRAVAIWS